MKTVKVENMTSYKGNKVANQFILKTSKGAYFQSYNSIIAFEDIDGVVTLDKTYWDYSNTTRKYRNIFLGQKSTGVKARIKNGTYKLADLN
jgi:hypothetical protein